LLIYGLTISTASADIPVEFGEEYAWQHAHHLERLNVFKTCGFVEKNKTLNFLVDACSIHVKLGIQGHYPNLAESIFTCFY
jgi:hypothetical protein